MSTFAAAVVDPRAATDRDAMGLPPGLVVRGPAGLARAVEELRSEPLGTLLAVVEGSDQSLARRYAAGQLLALVGDPRTSIGRPVMVHVPAGRTLVGTEPSHVARVVDRWRHVGVLREWIDKEVPRHEQELDAFAIGRYPVTNAEYRCFLEETSWPELPTSWVLGAYPMWAANHPVWTVTPRAADAYATWMAQRTGRAFRLPSEAEWEHASSGGDGREYPWGDEFDPACANTLEGGPLTTTPVGVHPAGASPWGVLDLAGNVEELVADSYRAYPGGRPVRDDLGGEGHRVARGGSFSRFGDLTRCSRRHGWVDRPMYAVGLRLAETPTEASADAIAATASVGPTWKDEE